MPVEINPEWQQLALYAVGAAFLLILLFRVPFVGRLLRFAFSLAILAFCIFLLVQQAPYQPVLAGFADRLGLDGQEVSGGEVRIRMSADGHFWARARLNGVERRLLVDSGATMTAISEESAAAAGVDGDAGLVPVVLKTANGLAHARTGTIEKLEVGTITARHLKIVVAPALGNHGVLGMNFLSKLKSWRVEGRTLILVPEGTEAASGA